MLANYTDGIMLIILDEQGLSSILKNLVKQIISKEFQRTMTLGTFLGNL